MPSDIKPYDDEIVDDQVIARLAHYINNDSLNLFAREGLELR